MSAIEVEAIVAGLDDPFQVHEVLIDGQRHGTVNGGESRSFKVTPGIHSVRLKLKSHSSPSVKVVVGFGTTSVVCQTTVRKLFGLFPAATPNTMILVREEADYASQPAAKIVWRDKQDHAPMHLAHALAD